MNESAARIGFAKDGNVVAIRPLTYLGSTWAAYKAACDRAGARSEKDKAGNWRQVASLDTAPAVLAALKGEGFAVVVENGLGDALLATAAVAAEATVAAEDRLAGVAERLARDGRALYPYQEAGVRWLAPRHAALLSDAMGLGKTVQALIAAPSGAPVLAVVPAIVKGNWRLEARKWRPDLTPTILAGRGAFRWPVAGEILIVNYDILPKTEIEGRINVLPAALGKPLAGSVVIFDECHKAKGSKTARTKATTAIAKAALDAGGYAWGLTGTPMLNRPPELWTVLNNFGLAREAFGSWARFSRIFGAYRTKWGTEWSGVKDSAAAVEALRKVSLRRTADDVLDLPPTVYRDVEVDLDEETRKLCDEVLAKLAALGINLDTAIAEAKGGAVVFEELSRARAALASAKVGALLDLVEEYEEAEEPLIVFSAHRAPIEALGKRDGWATILGGVDALKRSAIVEDFEGGRLKGIALTIGAGGEGITLVRGRKMVFVDLAWTPSLNAQAEARFRRIGQKASTLWVDRLVANHEIDKRVLELLGTKAALIDASVEAARVPADLPVNPATDIATLLAGVETVAEIGDPAEIEKRLKTEREAVWAEEKAVRLNLRGPEGPVEEWAARGLATLAALDPDRAAEKNNVGFNGADGGYGHWLAIELARTGKLGDKHWAAAVKMLGKYARTQIGAKPEERKEASG